MPIDQGTIESLSRTASIRLGPKYKVFVFLSDLCGSSDFKTYCKDHSVPDGAWIERQLIFLHRIISMVHRYKGVVVKTIGDEVMAYFPKDVLAEDVLRCATDCHAIFGDIQRFDNGTWRLLHKVSIDFGVVYDSNFGLVASGVLDPIGLPVDRCARLNAEAKQNQVVFSSSFFVELPAGVQERYAKYREHKVLRGTGASDFYRIDIREPTESE